MRTSGTQEKIVFHQGNHVLEIRVTDVIDILLVTMLVYAAVVLIRRTRAALVAFGLLILSAHVGGKLFERWGVYMIVADPEGETYWATADIPKSSVWFAHDSLDITSGDNTVVGDDMQYRIRWSAKDVTVDLVYDNYLPPWILGDGRDNLGDPERAF